MYHLSPSDVTVCQVAISWLLHQSTVTSVIIGARTLEQMEDNVNSAQVSLTKEEVRLGEGGVQKEEDIMRGKRRRVRVERWDGMEQGCVEVGKRMRE